MATKTSQPRKKRLTDEYFDMVHQFPLTSITSEKELDEAIEHLDTILKRPLSSPGELAYLDALSDLVALYENEHHPIGPAEPHELLQHLLEARQLTQQQLCLQTGISKSTISEILSAKKRFSLPTIKKLASFFNVSPSLFIK